MKKLLAIAGVLHLTVFLAACQSTPPDDVSQPVVAESGVVKSPNDPRDYDFMVLDNGLKVLLISDPAAKKAAVSLDVLTGSKDDPAGRNGLAHFLEHMLFLGTEKYPVAGEYQEYISAHGGRHNAYTSFENTNYFFDIDAPYLESALDRFSQFFVSPLFTAKYVDREKHAVESEYRAKLKNEARRGNDVFRQIINPEHPFSKFTVGTLETLADRPDSAVRDELLAFYDKHYSANQMNLVVLGSEPLDELQAMVEQRFAAVPNRGVETAPITQPLFSPGTLPAKLFVTPEQNIRTLEFTFPIPDPRVAWRSKPVHMIADVLGHEGEGSLLQYLKDQGWAESLAAGAGLEYDGGAALNVSIKLTQAGFKASDQVIAAVFQLVNRMEQEGISRQRFDEQARISALQFRYQDQRDNMYYVLELASDLRLYPAELVLEGPYLFDDYDKALFREYLAYLRPDNVLVTLTGPGLPADSQSRWYQTPYSLEPVPPEQLAQWQAVGVNPAITMPARNPFIPAQFERLASPYDDARPRLVEEARNLRVWFGDDGQFTAPRASLHLGLNSPIARDTATHAVAAKMLAAMVTDHLNPKLYPALLAGFSPRITARRQGLQLAVDGFSDKQFEILELMLKQLVEAPFDPRRFDDIRQEMIRNWQNLKRQPPYQYLPIALREALITHFWSEEARIAAAKALTLEDLEQYRRDFLARVQIDALAYGNFTAAQARQLRTLTRPILHPVKEEVALPGLELTLLQPGEPWRFPIEVEHGDAAIAYYVQGAGDDNHQRVLMGVTGQIISTPYYHSLRTEQQFGYIVYAGATVLERMPGITFTVQSPVADPATLVQASDHLMEGFRETAATMSEEEFARHKAALRSRINKPHKQLAQLAAYYWDQIRQDYLQFDRREQLTAALDALELPQWQAYYPATFPPRPGRALIVTQQGDHPVEAGAWQGTRLIEDAEAFKASQPRRRYP